MVLSGVVFRATDTGVHVPPLLGPESFVSDGPADPGGTDVLR